LWSIDAAPGCARPGSREARFCARQICPEQTGGRAVALRSILLTADTLAAPGGTDARCGRAPYPGFMLLRHAIGHVLRRIRLERRLTLRDLARDSRVSVPYLSEIERGRKEVSSEILATVCRVLDLSLADLLDAVSRELGAAASTADAGYAAPGRAPVVAIESRTDLAEGNADARASVSLPLTLLLAA
jgi:transcriptional regulator with XRE-family HTH domain